MNPPVKDSIGDRLRAERLDKGWTQEYFAALGGVRRQAQAKYESGQRTPDAKYLATLASGGGVDVQYVLTGVRSSNVPSQQQMIDAKLREQSHDESAGAEEEPAPEEAPKPGAFGDLEGTDRRFVPELFSALMQATSHISESRRVDVATKVYAFFYDAATDEDELREVTAQDLALAVDIVAGLTGATNDSPAAPELEPSPSYQRGERIVGEGDPEAHPPRRDSGWRITGEGDPDVHPTGGPGRLIQDWAGQQDEPDGLDEPAPARRKKKKRS